MHFCPTFSQSNLESPLKDPYRKPSNDKFLLCSTIQYSFDLRALSSEHNYFIMSESMIYVRPKYSSISNKEYCLLFQKQNEQQINAQTYTNSLPSHFISVGGQLL